MPKFKYELDFNIAEHDKWAACQLSTPKDIFDVLDSLREWTNPDRVSSRNIKVLTMPNFSDKPFEVGFEDLKQTKIDRGTVSFWVYAGPDHKHDRHTDVMLEVGTILIRHRWLDLHTLTPRTEIWIVSAYVNNNLVRQLGIKDEWGVWTLKDKEKK
jgi:hypothetical protein